MKFLLPICILLMVSCSDPQTLKEVFSDHDILIGAAVNVDEIAGRTPKAQEVIANNFNAIVAENCMKQETIAPEEGKYDFADADRLVEFGEQHGLTVTGHCLLWHSQAAPWFYEAPEGGELTRELMIDRIREYITTVVTRYKGRIKGWDVINEAVLDDGQLRDTPLLRIIGPDYFEIAFKIAHEADPDAELYLNDFSMAKPAKRAKYVEIIKDLKQAGCRIDAIGMQSHNGGDYPDLAEYEQSIEAFAACGVKVMMTELDLNILPQPEQFAGGANVGDIYRYRPELDPYKDGLPKEAEQLFEQRYLEFFKIYRRHADDISRITLWGVSDRTSWLNNWPVKGRTSYPLLFDREYNPKPVVKKIIDLFR